jgi:uncharacterized protein (DUF983 family)
MSNITCPLCGAPIPGRGLFYQGKPFCTHCGWNLERVASSLNGNSRFTALAVVGFGIIGVSLFWLSSNNARGGTHLLPALPILAFVALAGGIPLWSYFSTKRAIALAKGAPILQGTQAQPIPDAFLQRIQTLSRPRRVRFRFPGASAAIAVSGFGILAGVLVFSTARVGPPTHPQNTAPFPYFVLIGPGVFVVMILGIVILPAVLKEKLNRPLFQDGEVAAARVLVQHTVMRGKTSYSQIDYEFKTSGGQTIRNSERDLSGKVYEDMLIPIFYDPVNPSRCAALCASYSKLPDAEG